MKKNFKSIRCKIITGAVLGLITASCSQDTVFDGQDSDTSAEVVGRKIAVSVGNDHRSAPVSRTILTPDGNKLIAEWKIGDVASAAHFNPASPQSATSQLKSEKRGKGTRFSGNLAINPGESLVLFYPAVNSDTKSKTAVKSFDGKSIELDIKKQDGSLETLQSGYDVMYGTAMVAQKSSPDDALKANIRRMKNVMAICKLSFLKEGNPLKVDSVGVLDVPCEGKLDFSTGKVTPATYDGEEYISGKLLEPTFRITKIKDNATYIAFLPGKTKPLFVIYSEGEIYNCAVQQAADLQSNAFYNLQLEITERSAFVVTAALKGQKDKTWAKGNLLYDSATKKYSIAKHQWYISEYDKGRQESITYRPMSTEHDLFTWGKVGDDAGEFIGGPHAEPASTQLAIRQLLYKAKAMNVDQRTTNRNEAQYGDLPYWALGGHYALTSQGAMQFLMETNHVYLGYCTVGKRRIYGYFFVKPKIAVEYGKNYKCNLYPDESISWLPGRIYYFDDFSTRDFLDVTEYVNADKGLFLPLTGNKGWKDETITLATKYKLIGNRYRLDTYYQTDNHSNDFTHNVLNLGFDFSISSTLSVGRDENYAPIRPEYIP